MKLNFVGPVCGYMTSYSICTQSIVAELSKEHDVALVPIGPSQPAQYPSIVEPLKKGLMSFDVNADCVRLYHAFSQSMFVGKGRHIAFPIFELDQFNDMELHHLSSVDDIFVTSQWGRDVVESQLKGKKVHVIPLGVDLEIFNPPDADKHTNNSTTVFTHIGKAEIRKSSLDVIDCFNAAFEPEDDVKLYIGWFNRFYSKQDMDSWYRYAKESKLRDKIYFLKPDLPIEELSQLYKVTDCFVSMSKAEGWNMPLLEAMACGCHIIATNCTAQTEFCNKDNCLLIDVDEMEKAYDGKFFNGFGQWWKVDKKQHEQCIEYMRCIATSVPNYLNLNDSGIKTAKQFTWKNTAQQIIKVLEN